MKQVNRKNLIVGNTYYDAHGSLKIRLKFIGFNTDNTVCEFNQLSGTKDYITNLNGNIEFPMSGDPFYEEILTPTK